MSSHADFVCVCCGDTKSTDAGYYALPKLETGDSALSGYALKSCARCQHTQAHPFPDEELIKRYYSGSFWQDQGVQADRSDLAWKEKVLQTGGLRERYERASRQLSFLEQHRQLRQDDKIIDVGSGYSPFLLKCRERGHRNLFALDPSPKVCAYLRSQGVETYPCFVEQLVARPDVPNFDVIVLSHTAEHLLEPSRMIAALSGKLRPGGAFYVDVPYRDFERSFHLGLHLNFFSERSLSQTLERAGLKPVAVDADSPNRVERALLWLLYKVYGVFFQRGPKFAQGGSLLDKLHANLWSPFKRATGVRINIFISSFDLRALAEQRHKHSAQLVGADPDPG